MPDEQPKPIERRLKAWAERRRQELGPAMELHPADRARLLEEVARMVEDRQAASAVSIWRRLWPRVAFVAGTAALLVLVLTQLSPPGDRHSDMAVARLEKSAADSPPAAPASAPLADQPMDEALDSDPGQAAPATLTVGFAESTEALPDTGRVAEGLTADHSFQLSRPTEVLPGSRGVPVDTMVNAPRSPTLAQSRSRTQVASRPEVAAVSLPRADAEPETRSVAPLAKADMDDAGAPLDGANQTALAEMRAEPGFGASVMDRPATSTSTSAAPPPATFASRGSSPVPAAAPEPAVEVTSNLLSLAAYPPAVPPDWVAEFVRRDMPRRNLNATPINALRSFRLERRGAQVRLIDGDGSIYEGEVAPVLAPTADLTHTTGMALGLRPPSSDAFAIQVSGTSLSGRGELQFRGTVITGATARIQGEATLGGRARVVIEAEAPEP